MALTLAAILNLTHRGFTGHLQVDHANVIHMGGRIYDAHIGRFLQADPFVQAPSNSQSHNRYSYVLNNPLSMIDPSGYFFKTLKKYWRVIAAVVVAVYAPYLLNTVWGLGLSTVTTGAITGFVAGAISTGTFKGALTGAFTGAMFGGLHQMSAGALKVAAHGMAGGLSSVLSGGKFGHGFAAAGFTQFASQTAGDKLFVDGATELGDRAKNAVVAAAIGGTASTVSGGKFANGAITGAFSRLLNDDAMNKNLKRFGMTISNDAGKRHDELKNWQKSEDWNAAREKYPELAKVADSNMSLTTDTMMRDLANIQRQYLMGNVSQTFVEAAKNGWDIGSNFAPAPKGWKLISEVFGFASPSVPKPNYRFTVSRVGYVDVVPVMGGD